MDFSGLLADATKFNEYMDVVMVACGDADPRYDRTYEQDHQWSLQLHGTDLLRSSVYSLL